MIRLFKFLSLPRSERRLFCEAIILLPLATLSIRTIAFRHIYSVLQHYWRPTPNCQDNTELIRLVKLSVSRAASLFQSLCLSRSIVTLLMLRRRGVPVVMFAGAKLKESLLLAHAWVHAGHDMVDGKCDETGFIALLRIGQDPPDRLNA